ncbi:MAG: hypothetical protein ABI286_09675 [Edaphobacter sp.]
MNDRALLTLGISVFVIAVCSLIAVYVPRMRRIFWVVGLSLALLEFGGIAVGIAFRGITHRDLSGKGFFMLLANGYVAWIVFEYLRQKIARPKVNRSADSN